MPTLPTNPQSAGASGHVNDHNLIVSALSNAVYASGQTGTVNLSGATLKGAGLDLVYSSAISSATSKTADGVFTSTYDTYLIMLSAKLATGTTDATWTLRASGADATGTPFAYNRQFMALAATPTWVLGGSGGAATFVAGTLNATAESTMSITMMNPKATKYTTYNGHGMRTDGYSEHANGWCANTTAYDGIKVSSGTMTGWLRIYGYRNS